MDEINARGLYEQKISSMVENLLPYGAGIITEQRLRQAMETIAQAAFTAGKSYGLLNLMTVEQAAQEVGVSRRRMAEIIRIRHERFGIGMMVGKSWIIHHDELESLRPGPKGWPKGHTRKKF